MFSLSLCLSNSFFPVTAEENHVVVDMKVLYSSAELEQNVCALPALAVVLLLSPREHHV